MIEKHRVRPTILLVEDDEEIRDQMKDLLQRQGYLVVLVFDEHESNDVVGGNNLKIGLIVIDQKMVSDEALAAGRRIRQHAHVGDSVPVVVIPFEFSKEMEGKDECMGGSDYKSYIANSTQLETLLARLLPVQGSSL